MLRVEVVVHDRGTAPVHYQHVCRWPNPDRHEWTLMKWDGGVSTWFCTACQRIEQRILRDD